MLKPRDTTLELVPFEDFISDKVELASSIQRHPCFEVLLFLLVIYLDRVYEAIAQFLK